VKNKIDYALYLCTDRKVMSTTTIEEAVELALIGGCTIVQLREKECSSKEFYELALRVKRITDTYQVPLIINDRVDIALAINAAGVHVGQSDLPASAVRQMLGNKRILGVSASSLLEARKAVEDGADYIGVGAMYATKTKGDARSVSLKVLKEICEAVPIPVVAIGGINVSRIPELKEAGVAGLAVISAIIGQKDIICAARNMKDLFAI